MRQPKINIPACIISAASIGGFATILSLGIIESVSNFLMAGELDLPRESLFDFFLLNSIQLSLVIFFLYCWWWIYKTIATKFDDLGLTQPDYFGSKRLLWKEITSTKVDISNIEFRSGTKRINVCFAFYRNHIEFLEDIDARLHTPRKSRL